MKNRINEIFGGDIDDTESKHNNSLCRIAYCGYLKYRLWYRCKEISDITNFKVGTVRKRLDKHRSFMAVDKIYRSKFKQIMSPKEEAEYCHTIASLVVLLADKMDELMPDTKMASDFKEKAKELMPIAESMMEAAFDVEEVRTSTYINDLSNKIDTVIRKNFKQVV